jgi:hypothetical protein
MRAASPRGSTSIPLAGSDPGDIAIERSGFSLYFPLMTSLIISVVLSVILWLVNR